MTQPASKDTAVEPPPFDPTIAVALAEEGVPVRAIARSLFTPADDIRLALHDAIAVGRLLDMPKEDWPPGSRRSDHAPLFTHVVSTAMFIVACRDLYKLTPLQAKILRPLLYGPSATREKMLASAQQNRAENAEEINSKIVDVVVCLMRKKLKPFFDGANIFKTLHGYGYAMERVHRDAIIEAVNEFAGFTVPTDKVAVARSAEDTVCPAD